MSSVPSVGSSRSQIERKEAEDEDVLDSLFREFHLCRLTDHEEEDDAGFLPGSSSMSNATYPDVPSSSAGANRSTSYDGFQTSLVGDSWSLLSYPCPRSRSAGSAPQKQGDYLVRLSMEEEGSKYLQYVAAMDRIYADTILDSILPRVFDVMTHSHGSHLFAKLVKLEYEGQLFQIATRLLEEQGQLFRVSYHKQGSRSLKVLIRGLAKSPAIRCFIRVFYPEFLPMMCDSFASKVVLHCYEYVDGENSQELYDLAIQHCLLLATHEVGCVALNQCIVHIKKAEKRSELLALIASHSVFLSQDPLGNYVLQHVLELHHPQFTEQIILLLQGHYARLSTSKVASHVVEKCILSGGLAPVARELLEDRRFVRIASDPFGNFVIQTALKEAKKLGDPIFNQLKMKIQLVEKEIQHGYGKNVLKWMMEDVPPGQ